MASARSIAVLWAQFGPYHFARAAALSRLAEPRKVHALEMGDRSADYGWARAGSETQVITLCPGRVAERLRFGEVFRNARHTFRKLRVEVCLLPGYAPKQSLAALLAAKSLGLRTVMMNESHAGTARARGVALWAKRRLTRLFDAALVGGRPQKRYYESLGLPRGRIFTGYDAVDNDYFAGRAAEIRSQAEEFRAKYKLPRHFFLSLGRFVPKKNLEFLIQAYHQFRLLNPSTDTHLVMVGSGPEESRLLALCNALRLPVYHHAKQATESCDQRPPGVHFFGFRQIDENPVFYTLADVFILPSLWEEWGLVVNEAMACGVPVVVSATAGCAEDLLEPWDKNVRIPLQTALDLDRVGLTSNLRNNGFVFNPQSPDELGKVAWVLESSKTLRNLMGQASRRNVEKFSCDNFGFNAVRAVHAALGETVSFQRHPVADRPLANAGQPPHTR
jgi:glycosyltransferase involved in cell wall biosynthesis